MGQTLIKDMSLQQLVRKCLEDWERTDEENPDILLRVSYPKSQRVGFRLWKVAHWNYYSKSSGELINSRQLIYVDVFNHQPNQGWYHRELCENEGPAYYDCPPLLLVGLPEPENEYSQNWREKVLLWHKEQADIKRRMKIAKVGEIYSLKNSDIPQVKITSLKPLMGEYNGRVYKIPSTMFGDLIA